MHLENLLHNDLNSNNVLLKLRNNVWILSRYGKWKVSLKSNPETYKESKTQRDGYNELYPHLVYDLRNIYGSKTLFWSGVFSFSYA